MRLNLNRNRAFKRARLIGDGHAIPCAYARRMWGQSNERTVPPAASPVVLDFISLHSLCCVFCVGRTLGDYCHRTHTYISGPAAGALKRHLQASCGAAPWSPHFQPTRGQSVRPAPSPAE